jgi:hypothetical protein
MYSRYLEKHVRPFINVVKMAMALQTGRRPERADRRAGTGGVSPVL